MKAAGPPPPSSSLVVDLGSGGGLPGLVLAEIWTDVQVVLLDAHGRRCAFLTRTVQQLRWEDRVTVVCERAEESGRGPLRERAHVVTARSFGPPAVTAELGGALLAVGGRLVVSEPPGAPDERWSAPVLRAELSLDVAAGREVDGRWYRTLTKVGPLSDRYPRPVGRPTKRPLF